MEKIVIKKIFFIHFDCSCHWWKKVLQHYLVKILQSDSGFEHSIVFGFPDELVWSKEDFLTKPSWVSREWSAKNKTYALLMSEKNSQSALTWWKGNRNIIKGCFLGILWVPEHCLNTTACVLLLTMSTLHDLTVAIFWWQLPAGIHIIS